MSCLLVIFSLFLPRLLMIAIWVFSDWFSQAYNSLIWPVLGLIFMPYTTLAYMAAMLNNNHQVTGGWIVLVIIGIVIDLGGQGRSIASR